MEIYKTFRGLYLFPICRIDSEHNKKVSNIIVQEVGTTKYSRRQIQGVYNMV